MKQYIGFNGYQIRNEKAIKRFWLILQFTCIIAMKLKNKSFNKAITEIRSSKVSSIVEFIYQQAEKGVPLKTVKIY